ncbi:hypothetical protein [Accumulibacter sp.]|uniref:hypothetical protein n=1 Tax=Accumulibacter sp. TaxID=2053492 RepID=UPI001A5CC4E6|nr:hypothetical protein [Accumulibacter sp.]MBL8400602.1 hypothetical protein [Accumulibacter sp.]
MQRCTLIPLHTDQSNLDLAYRPEKAGNVTGLSTIPFRLHVCLCVRGILANYLLGASLTGGWPVIWRLSGGHAAGVFSLAC